MTTLYEDELDTDLLHEMRHHQKVLDKEGGSARVFLDVVWGAPVIAWAYNSGDLIPAITAIYVLLIRICIGLCTHSGKASKCLRLSSFSKCLTSDRRGWFLEFNLNLRRTYKIGQQPSNPVSITQEHEDTHNNSERICRGLGTVTWENVYKFV